MKKIFLILTLFSLITYSQNDSIHFSQNKKSSDTVDVKIVETPKLNWIERNEGAIISAVVGLLIAFITILCMHKSNKRIEKNKLIKEDQKVQEIYKGYLFAIKEEIVNHQKLIPFIKEEFEGIISKSIELNRLIIEKPSRKIPLTYLTELRIKLLDLEIYNSQIFTIFTRYVAKCELINNDVDLSTIVTLIENIKEEISFEDALNEYLSKMNTEIVNVLKGAEGLILYVNDDLRKMGVDIEKIDKDYSIRSS